MDKPITKAVEISIEQLIAVKHFVLITANETEEGNAVYEVLTDDQFSCTNLLQKAAKRFLEEHDKTEEEGDYENE